MEDPYEVLGVTKDATADEIRSAFRQLARRWHPDRFPDGPERMWAEVKMAEINEAHKLILSGKAGHLPFTPKTMAEEEQQFEDIRKLMDMDKLFEARQALMRMQSRGPEWNYLFGAVLLRLGDFEKACLYFGVAANQRPDDPLYRGAYRSAQAVRDSRRAPSFISRLFGNSGKVTIK